MKKIAFIGAGSFGFTRTLVKDLLTYEAFNDCIISLMDIDPERLSYITKAVEKIIKAGNYKATVQATMDRKEALKDADGVLITILQGGVEVWRHDVEIPMKYGVDLVVGDTRGPAGIFRALRTIPVMLDIARDIEKYCPNAIVLNYTNPMAMLCRAVQGETNINMTGLCHSVQGTAEMLASWIGAPMDEITYLCAGINHQAWYLEFKWNGKDAYPLIKEAIKKGNLPRNWYGGDSNIVELCRNDMFLHLDYYVTESSGHNSEYNQWYRKRPDIIEKFFPENDGDRHAILKHYLRQEENWRKDIEEWLESPEIDLKRGNEYAANIFNAIIGDGTTFEFNGNVRNFGLIDNLPWGCCVEVPIYASKSGLRPVHVGPLPAHLAILNNVNAQCEELAVEGALTGNKRKIYHAICMDPLTSSVLSLSEIKSMVDEMFEANKEWLPQFK